MFESYFCFPGIRRFYIRTKLRSFSNNTTYIIPLTKVGNTLILRKILGINFQAQKLEIKKLKTYESDYQKLTHQVPLEASNKSSETMMASESVQINLGLLLQDHQPIRDTVIGNYK